VPRARWTGTAGKRADRRKLGQRGGASEARRTRLTSARALPVLLACYSFQSLRRLGPWAPDPFLSLASRPAERQTNTGARKKTVRTRQQLTFEWAGTLISMQKLGKLDE
jgi:hypothetical protein